MLLVYLELYLIVVYPGGQRPTPFIAAYENMKSVFDGLFQSFLFSLFQVFYLTDGINQMGAGFTLYSLIISTSISIIRGLGAFAYLESLHKAYDRSRFSLFLGLTDLKPSFKWPKWLDYSKPEPKNCTELYKCLNLKNVWKYTGLDNMKRIEYPPVSFFMYTIF